MLKELYNKIISKLRFKDCYQICVYCILNLVNSNLPMRITCVVGHVNHF